MPWQTCAGRDIGVPEWQPLGLLAFRQPRLGVSPVSRAFEAWEEAQFQFQLKGREKQMSQPADQQKKCSSGAFLFCSGLQVIG